MFPGEIRINITIVFQSLQHPKKHMLWYNINSSFQSAPYGNLYLSVLVITKFLGKFSKKHYKINTICNEIQHSLEIRDITMYACDLLWVNIMHLILYLEAA